MCWWYSIVKRCAQSLCTHDMSTMICDYIDLSVRLCIPCSIISSQHKCSTLFICKVFSASLQSYILQSMIQSYVYITHLSTSLFDHWSNQIRTTASSNMQSSSQNTIDMISAYRFFSMKIIYSSGFVSLRWCFCHFLTDGKRDSWFMYHYFEPNSVGTPEKKLTLHWCCHYNYNSLCICINSQEPMNKFNGMSIQVRKMNSQVINP